jgi:hypothetical protein
VTPRSRIPYLAAEELSDEQRRLAKQLAASRGGRLVGPGAFWLRNPALAEQADAWRLLMERGTALPRRLSELAILVANRHFSGYEGEVGCASGPHLHFEVAVPEDPADPIDAEGCIRGGSARNRVPRICGISDQTLVEGTRYQARPARRRRRAPRACSAASRVQAPVDSAFPLAVRVPDRRQAPAGTQRQEAACPRGRAAAAGGRRRVLVPAAAAGWQARYSPRYPLL